MSLKMFFIVGAQKAGTTALWQYLRQHPEIDMPQSKEAPYFASNEMMSQGWEWYRTRYFTNTNSARIAGTASPQYMCHPYAAENIYKRFPNSKIIAVLRDPIHRAISHYKMAVRWGHEERSLITAFRDELIPSALEISRHYKLDEMSSSDHKHCYVAWGEYKRILDEYLHIFKEDQILLITQDELLGIRQATYRKILSFLDVDPSFIPSNLEVNYHVGQIKKRDGIIEMVSGNSLIRKIGKTILTSRQREAIGFWLKTRGSRAEKILVPREVYQSLQKHYAADVQWLSEILGRELGWLVHAEGDIYL